MGSWSDIGLEIQQAQANIDAQIAAGTLQPNIISGMDVVRRKYLKELSQHDQRNVILYASCWLHKTNIPENLVMVYPGDLDGFMEVVNHSDKDNKNLSLILHSPGGLPEAAEQIVTYLRQKFDHIRVYVPHMAMSAATMIALAADEIYMARHSTLGPTDPQFVIQTNTRQLRQVSAHALLEEFSRAKGSGLPVWGPILSQYPPGLLVQCRHAIELTRSLVADWLNKYMFKDSHRRKAKADKVSDYFCADAHHSHSRPLMHDSLSKLGLEIKELEEDQIRQDALMSVYHATVHTFRNSYVTKLVEGDSGKAFMNLLPRQP